jgi:hypothetical protein
MTDKPPLLKGTKPPKKVPDDAAARLFAQLNEIGSRVDALGDSLTALDARLTAIEKQLGPPKGFEGEPEASAGK